MLLQEKLFTAILSAFMKDDTKYCLHVLWIKFILIYLIILIIVPFLFFFLIFFCS